MRNTDERGLSQSIQLTLLFPVFIGVFLLGLQWAMHAWASAVALAAAQDGARAAAAYSAQPAAGEHAARQAIDTDALQEASVSISRGAETTSVTVSGRALSVVPFFDIAVSKSASVPTERLTR